MAMIRYQMKYIIDKNILNNNGLKILDIEFVKNMFKELNCIGNTNCFLVAANRNFMPEGLQNKVGMKRAGQNAGGFVGGMIGAAIDETTKQIEQELIDSIKNPGLKMLTDNNIYGYILNFTEYGVGIVPLHNNSLRMSKAIAHPEEFKYITYNFIESTKFKKIPFNFNRKFLYIVWNEGNKPQSIFSLRVKDKVIKYQKDNFVDFEKIYKDIIMK